MAEKEIQYYLNRIDQTVGIWEGFLNKYSLEMLHRKPNRSSWSLGQVYTHIIEETEYFIEQMKTALNSDEHTDKSMHEHARDMFANDEFPDEQLTSPSNDPDIPQPADKVNLTERLNGIRDKIRIVFENYGLEKNTGKTPHPGLQYFSAVEWLRFAEMHMRHHLRQKKRIDEQLAFNK